MTNAATFIEYRRSAGAALVALGIVFNPRVIGWLLAPDGSIDGEARVWQILLVDTFLVLAGTTLVWDGLRARLSPYVSSLIGWASMVAVTTAAIVGTAWGIWAYQTAHQHTHLSGSLAPPTAAEQQWANDFVRQSWESARTHGWLDLEKAKADGYFPQWGDRAHWANREFLFDDRILDPTRPEFLMFEDSPSGKILVGFMFFTRTLEESGPTPGGSLAQWHYHPWPGRGYCAERELLVVSRPDDNGHCAAGVRVNRSAEMLHVYFVDHPMGPFTDVMQFPQAKTMRDAKLVHPMVVHFGLALFIVSVLLDLAGRITARPALHTAAAVNLLIAVPATLAAVGSGMLAEVQLVIPHEVHAILDTHKLLAFSSLGGVIVLGAWRLATGGRFPVRWGGLYLATGLVAAGLMAGAGHRGAEMVFVHGAAVQAIDRFAMERYQRSLFGGQAVPAPPRTTHAGH